MRSGVLFFMLLVIPFSFCKSQKSDSKILQKKLDIAIADTFFKLNAELKTEVPSLSVYIVSPKGSFFSSKVGANGTKVTKDTYFRFASNTKTFTAAAILKMAQDGWLKLDDKLSDKIPNTTVAYTPDVPDWQFPYRNEISIREVLQHNAGIYDLSNDASQYNIKGETYTDYILAHQPDFQFSADDYARVLTKHQLSYGKPNSVYHYSNTGYTVLGEIIARVYSQKSKSQKTYADYLYDYITGAKTSWPLSVSFPALASDQQLQSPYVKGLIYQDSGDVVTDKINASGHLAEGNGIGTMADLSLFVRSLMKAENVLNKTSVEMMQHDKGLANGNEHDYGLGCAHFQNIGYGHNGATEGYLSLMAYDPRTDVSVVVLLPFWDLTNNQKNFPICLKTLNNTALSARKALGY